MKGNLFDQEAGQCLCVYVQVHVLLEMDDLVMCLLTFLCYMSESGYFSHGYVFIHVIPHVLFCTG